jgi:Toastrack DUF4097
MRNAGAVLVLMLGTLAGTNPASAQDFNWRGRLSSGKEIEIKGVNGGIHAVAASGNELRVSAVKSARRSDPDEVEIEVLEHADGITICAVYPSRRRDEPNECRHGSNGRMNVRDNDVKVEFEVEVPAGVSLVARTVNGKINAEGLGADIHAYTVNGDVTLATTGIAEAKTVNGSIRASLGRANMNDDLEFETVNGGITIEIAGELNAEVSASTVNGGIETDFPITVQGRFGQRRLNGRIGNGGHNLALATVNGSIAIRRR